MKYIVSYKTKFGTVSAESDYPDDLLVGYQTLKQLASKLESASSKENRGKAPRKSSSGSSEEEEKNKTFSSRGGQGETTNILRELELKLLSTTFFSRPRSTGETKAKLDAVSGRNFTSRKVSQALGILWKKGELKRKGTRNYYVYSK